MNTASHVLKNLMIGIVQEAKYSSMMHSLITPQTSTRPSIFMLLLEDRMLYTVTYGCCLERLWQARAWHLHA